MAKTKKAAINVARSLVVSDPSTVGVLEDIDRVLVSLFDTIIGDPSYLPAQILESRTPRNVTVLPKAVSTFAQMVFVTQLVTAEKLTRDWTLTYATDQTYAGALSQLMCAAARCLDGFSRHNALCLYAVASLKLGSHQLALAALQTVLAEDPHHRLASLAFEAMMRGDYDLIVDGCAQATSRLRTSITEVG